MIGEFMRRYLAFLTGHGVYPASRWQQYASTGESDGGLSSYGAPTEDSALSAS